MDLINLFQKLIGFMVFPLIKMNVATSKKEERKEAMWNCKRDSAIQLLKPSSPYIIIPQIHTYSPLTPPWYALPKKKKVSM